MASAPPPWIVAFVHQRCPGCWSFIRETARRVNVAQPFTVSSWYRSAAYNASVGGAARSQHIVGLALDLVGPGAPEVGAQLRSMGWTTIDEGDHIHVQVFKANPF